jgi:hypothetical protein
VETSLRTNGDIMSLFSLPTVDSADNTQTIVLEKVAYDVRMQWSTRDEAWNVFWGISGEGVKFKFKIVNGLDLLKPYRAYDECPKGNLFILDNERTYGRVGRSNLGIGKRFSLMYLTSDDPDEEGIRDVL